MAFFALSAHKELYYQMSLTILPFPTANHELSKLARKYVSLPYYGKHNIAVIADSTAAFCWPKLFGRSGLVYIAPWGAQGDETLFLCDKVKVVSQAMRSHAHAMFVRGRTAPPSHHAPGHVS